MPRATKAREPIAPFSEEERVIVRLAQESFSFFLMHIFPESFRNSNGELEMFPLADGSLREFSLGRIHYHWANILQTNNRVCILAPRLHLKSTVVHHAWSFWQLFKSKNDIYGASISYKEELASSHTERIKACILKNKYCRFWIDRKTTSDSIVDFKISFGEDDPYHRGKILPYGILGNIRGEHPDFAVCDDILSDLANPLEPKQIMHIDNVFAQVVSNLPRKNGPIAVIGTPQSFDDTLYQLRTNSQYFWAKFPAEWEDDRTNPPTKRCLWPEVFDFRQLHIKLEEIHQRAYDIEYLLTPIMSTETFFPEWAIDAITDPDLRPADPNIPFKFPNSVAGIYGGMDVGKDVHPTHVSICAQLKTGDLIQIYEEFLDNMTYDKQAAVINRLIKNFAIKRFYYDSTRSEMDDRQLSRRAIGLKFTQPERGQMALSMESRVFANPGQPGLVLLPDERQKKQILQVDKRFKGIETSDGHGDAAFSIALMCRAADDGPAFTNLGDIGTLFAGQTSNQGGLARLLSGR